MNDVKLTGAVGMVHSTESFGGADGPGLRYIFFMQGCKMRCKYCHNPETWSMEGGMEMTPSQIMEKAIRFKAYWKNGGGITVSGGEALLQIDFVIELFRLAKQEGINTCLDTSGNPFTNEEKFLEKFNTLCDYTDLFILDIKHIDEEKHKQIDMSKKQVRCLRIIPHRISPVFHFAKGFPFYP